MLGVSSLSCKNYWRIRKSQQSYGLESVGEIELFRSMRFDAPGVHPINNVHIILLNVRKKIMLKNVINAQNFLASKIEEMLRRSDEYEKKCREVCTDEEYQMLKSSFFQ